MARSVSWKKMSPGDCVNDNRKWRKPLLAPILPFPVVHCCCRDHVPTLFSRAMLVKPKFAVTSIIVCVWDISISGFGSYFRLSFVVENYLRTLRGPLSHVCSWKKTFVGFYRRMHYSAKRGIAIACRPSVCPFVGLYVTLVDHLGN